MILTYTKIFPSCPFSKGEKQGSKLRPFYFKYFIYKISHLGDSFFFQFSSVQSLSSIWHFAIQWTAARQASLSITNFGNLLKLMSIESVMPSSHLILCCPLLLPWIFPSIRVFSNVSVLHIRCPKYWSFNFSISPSNEYSGLIYFRIDFNWPFSLITHIPGFIFQVSQKFTISRR